MDGFVDFLKRAKSAIDETPFGAFNFSMDTGGFMDIVWLVVNIFFTVVTVILGAIIVGILGTYVWRYFYHKARPAIIGDIIWNEVIFDGIVSDTEWVNAGGQSDNMANIMKNDNAGMNFGIQYRRPRYLIAMRLSPEDEQLHMYIGVNRKAYNENVLAGWAAGANCSLEPVDFSDIGFVPRAPMTLVLQDYDTANFTEMPKDSTVGKVVRNLQNSSVMKEGGTVVVSYEPMSDREERATAARINAENYERGSEASRMDMTARNVNIFTSKTPCRGVITSFSDIGSYSSSKSLLDTVRGNIPNLGVRNFSAKYQDLHRKAGFLTILPSILLLVLGIIQFVPMWIPLIFVALSVLTIAGVPSLSATWVSKASAKEMNPPIPPYLRVSPRRILNKMSRRVIPSKNPSGYVPAPSMREVVPLYQASLMQFASMPKDGARNVAKNVIPQVPMSSSVNREIIDSIKSREVALMGTSVKTFDPVMFTTGDLNNGLAIAGSRGSGKTNALRVLYAGVSHLSATLDDYRFTPFWLETKSEDLQELIDQVSPYDPKVVYAHDRNRDTRIAFEGRRFCDGADMDEVKKNISNLVTSIEKLWNRESVGPQSKQVAHAAITLAMLLNKNELDELGISPRLTNSERPNIMQVTYYLIGADPSITMVAPQRRAQAGREQERGVLEVLAEKRRKIITSPKLMSLVEAKRGRREVERIQMMVPALDQLINLYWGDKALDPMKNKIPVLLKSEGMWETVKPDGTPRQEVPITSLLDYGKPVIVDLTENYSTLSSADKVQFSMLFHYMLWTGILEHCAGWGQKKKFTPIFVDELVYLTGTKSDNAELSGILEEALNQGRSYGTSHFVGHQSYTQLPPEAENTVRGMKSQMYCFLPDSRDRDIVMSLIGDRTRYTSESIADMPMGYSIANMFIGNSRRSVFTMKTPYAPTYIEALKRKETVLGAFKELREQEKEAINRDKNKGRTDADIIATQDPYGDDLDMLTSMDSHHDSHQGDSSYGSDSVYDDGFSDVSADGSQLGDVLDWLE